MVLQPMDRKTVPRISAYYRADKFADAESFKLPVHSKMYRSLICLSWLRNRVASNCLTNHASATM